jgi:TRAP-type C4-dicarboxylate transport system substrate-binding protein
MKAISRKHLICSIGLLVALIVCIAIPSWAAEEKVIKLRYASYFPPTHPVSKLTEEWSKEVEKRTDGRIKITFFPGNTLTPPMQTYESVVKGIADIGHAMQAWSPGRFPLTEVVTLPMGISSGYQATKMANAYYNKFRPKEFDDTKVMYFHAIGPGLLHLKKQVSSLDDIKGLRIRTNTDQHGIVKAVGAVPVDLPITESYDALSKGLLDGLLLPMDVLKGWRFAELVKTTLEISALGYTAPHYVVMNKDKWSSTSRADQQAIEKINDEWVEKHGKLWNDLDKEAREFGIQKGVKMVKATKGEETRVAQGMKPLLEEYVQAKKAKGLPAEDALKFCLDYIKAHP